MNIESRDLRFIRGKISVLTFQEFCLHNLVLEATVVRAEVRPEL